MTKSIVRIVVFGNKFLRPIFTGRSFLLLSLEYL